ncbi:aspartate aminotransferase family protein [uncultured Aeromicrobium sp.]|uniref:aspartate aminotransferase family protein n=1 Tax=uncultured Aeromicrobium sp. TaxID=337820 RepID=UPI002600DB49|nr:aminotransferase class III-fold pyridoxal phosphate-dependent enzyme [uncultured Aeromicrobium sp.]
MTVSSPASWAVRASTLFPPAATRHTDLVVTSARGATVRTEEGEELLDFASGVAVTNVGHGHPAVLRAIRQQMDALVHAGHNVALYPPYIELAERLVTLMGKPGEHKVYFSNSGAEALEGALKLAIRTSGRSGIVAFKRSFHGRTLATTALTASSAHYRRHYGAVLPTVHHIDYPSPFARQATEEAEVARCLAEVDELFRLILPPDDIAAIVIEPFQGEGGYVPAPRGFLRGLRERADQHGICLVFDEIQSGFGRTGKMFAWEHSGVAPDVIVLAKGIANGLPLSALVARSSLMDRWDAGAHGGTYGGNPLSCAAALAVIDVLHEGALENARSVGSLLRDGIADLLESCPIRTDVRGHGVMIGIEFRDEEHQPATASVAALVAAARERGLLLLSCGVDKNVLRLMPPTTLTEQEARRSLEILKESAAAVFG